eukprot:scaffold102478_cov63-Phaeocystis_antarctica.AAC.1
MGPCGEARVWRLADAPRLAGGAALARPPRLKLRGRPRPLRTLPGLAGRRRPQAPRRRSHRSGGAAHRRALRAVLRPVCVPHAAPIAAHAPAALGFGPPADYSGGRGGAQRRCPDDCGGGGHPTLRLAADGCAGVVSSEGGQGGGDLRRHRHRCRAGRAECRRAEREVWPLRAGVRGALDRGRLRALLRAEGLRLRLRPLAVERLRGAVDQPDAPGARRGGRVARVAAVREVVHVHSGGRLLRHRRRHERVAAHDGAPGRRRRHGGPVGPPDRVHRAAAARRAGGAAPRPARGPRRGAHGRAVHGRDGGPPHRAEGEPALRPVVGGA